MQSRLIGRKARLETAEVGIDRILGSCEAMRRVKEAILMASEVGAPILVTGETGTGKELVARPSMTAASGRAGYSSRSTAARCQPI